MLFNLAANGIGAIAMKLAILGERHYKRVTTWHVHQHPQIPACPPDIPAIDPPTSKLMNTGMLYI